MTAADRNEMNRRVAELLGWTWVQFGQVMCWKKPDGTKTPKGQFTTDANQADAAVLEAEARGIITKAAWVKAMTYLIPDTTDPDTLTGVDLDLAFWCFATATPEQKIKALLAASDALKVARGGA